MTKLKKRLMELDKEVLAGFLEIILPAVIELAFLADFWGGLDD